MVGTQTFTLLVLAAHGLLAHGAAVYKVKDTAPQAEVPLNRAPVRTDSSPSTSGLPREPQAPTDLELDLENAKATNNGAKTTPNQQEEASSVLENDDTFLDDAHENDLDLELLYDLVRAVEYEANAQLFDKVLQDLDNANYPVPPVAESRRITPGRFAQAPAEVPSSSQVESLPLTGAQEAQVLAQLADVDRQGEVPAVGAAAGNQKIAPDVKVSQGDDSRGQVTAQGIPVPQQPVPLHKRLAAALRDVPVAGKAVLPMDGLADKRNMFKKARE